MGNEVSASGAELESKINDELPLTNVMGMSTLVIPDTAKVVILGERHDSTSDTDVNTGDLLAKALHQCNRHLDFIYEDNIAETKNVGKGLKIPKDDGQTLTQIYKVAFAKQKCTKIRLFPADVRNRGIMSYIQYVQSGFKGGDELWKELDLAVDMVKDNAVLCWKLFRVQRENILDSIAMLCCSFSEYMHEAMVDEIDFAREKAQEGNWLECLKTLNWIMDWNFNIALLRKVCDRRMQPVRIVYCGEMHRRQLIPQMQHYMENVYGEKSRMSLAHDEEPDEGVPVTVKRFLKAIA